MAGNEGQKLIASIVLNGVVGDSRVIKTAKAAEAAGYKAVLFGLGNNLEPQEIDIEGTRVILVRNPALDLIERGMWSSTYKPFGLMVDLAAEAIAAEILRIQPDLVHSHDMRGLKVGALAARALAAHGKPVPWVHDLHEYVAGLTTLPPEAVAPCVEDERLYLRQPDHLITVSPALADVLSSEHLLEVPPTVVLNAPEYRPEFDESAPDVKSAIGLGRDSKLVIYVGGAKKERGCETIVRAVATLPDVHLCFVSNSDRYVEKLRKIGARLGMASRFHTHPYVASDQVTTFIRTADVGTHGLTHYPNGEVALPNKLFEYLQAGIPMVLSDVASMKVFLEEHGVGRVFEAENETSCAHAIKTALSDAEDIRNRITVDMKRRYSWQAQAEKIAAIYTDLLGKQTRQNGAVIDNNASLDVFSSEHPQVPVIYVGREEPRIPVAMRIDPATDHDLGGIATIVASRFSALVLHDSPAWPDTAGAISLAAGGVELSTSGRVDARHKLVSDFVANLPVTSPDLKQEALRDYDAEIWRPSRELRKEFRRTLFSVPQASVAAEPQKRPEKQKPKAKPAAPLPLHKKLWRAARKFI